MLKKIGLNVSLLGVVLIFVLQVVSLTATQIISRDVDVYYSIDLLSTSAIVIPILLVVFGITIITYSVYRKK